MRFSNETKLTALAIVSIFETSRPLGDYAACVVLDDGAGVSYGICQFTHRSGSLLEVVRTYLETGGTVCAGILREHMSLLVRQTDHSIRRLGESTTFRNALRAAADTAEMRAAQQRVAFERYMRPAIAICEKRGFELPLSLAVVYDSVIHGSWERISAKLPGPAVQTRQEEMGWITEYVRKRHLWLGNIARLRATAYRTSFFLGQIGIGNWQLRLPLKVNGHLLRSLPEPKAAAAEPEAAAETVPVTRTNVTEAVSVAADKFDKLEYAVTAVTSRKDAAKSLWTTVIGTLGQVFWAIFGFLTGLPLGVWIFVAAVSAALMMLYLYRQVELGKIRERANAAG